MLLLLLLFIFVLLIRVILKGRQKGERLAGCAQSGYFVFVIFFIRKMKTATAFADATASPCQPLFICAATARYVYVRGLLLVQCVYKVR